MSICKRCAEEADGAGDISRLVCSVCGRFATVYATEVPLDQQSVYVHKQDGVRCPGSCEPPRLITGHDFCDGCPCQHRPSGSWKGNRS